MQDVKCPRCAKSDVYFVNEVKNDAGEKISEMWYCKKCKSNFGVHVELLKKLGRT